MNAVLALIVVIGFLVYIAVELGWGGSFYDWQNYHRPHDAVRRKRRGPRDWSWFRPKTPTLPQPDKRKIPERVH